MEKRVSGDDCFPTKKEHPEVNGVTFCKRCLMPNTRPWGEFVNGLCGACRFDEKKNKEIDWEEREVLLKGILSQHRGWGDYDVLVPVSGGKDGSYTAYQMKEKYGARVLTATLQPPMWSDLGLTNLQRFSRFTNIPNILVTPPYDAYQAINWKGMIEMGYPKRGFVSGLVPSMMRVAAAFDIPMIMWGEHEEEYEGEREIHNKKMFIEYNDFLNSDDFCGQDPTAFNEIIEGDTSFWNIPEYNGMQCYFSRFEKWNSLKHALTAIQKCGMQTERKPSLGTYTMDSQTDDQLYTFFMYMAFVKFGFARVTNDVGIDCRQNGFDRFAALTELEDREDVLPMQCWQDARWYFDKTGSELVQAVHQHYNKDLLDYDPSNWFQQYTLKPELKRLRREIVYNRPGKGGENADH